MGHNVWEYRKRLEEKSVLLCYLTAAGGQRDRHMHIEPDTLVPWPSPSFTLCCAPWMEQHVAAPSAALQSPAQLRLLP